jgi:thiamine transport system substrate-binding protein
MYVFPANRNATLPQLFVDYTTVVDDPLTLTPEEIEQNREAWVEEWTDIVLR